MFVISGFWHGANWTFIIWGALHALYIIIPNFYSNVIIYKLKVPKFIKMMVTFNLVCFAWIFFRANSLSDSLYIISHLFIFSDSFVLFDLSNDLVSEITRLFPYYLALVIILLSYQILELKYKISEKIIDYYPVKRWFIYYTLFFGILLLHTDSSNFIYFQF